MIANIFANLVKYLIWYPIGIVLTLVSSPFVILMHIVLYSNKNHTVRQKDEFEGGLIKYVFRGLKEFSETWFSIHLT